MLYLQRILMVLMAVRLLLPPGICVCKLSPPAARLLVRLLQSDRQIPPPVEESDADDHDPGCPCSPLAAAMGVRPSAEPPAPPDLSFDPPPPPEATAPAPSSPVHDLVCLSPGPRGGALYLTLCALLI